MGTTYKAVEVEVTLAFSALENIRSRIETVSLEQAADVYARMTQGKAVPHNASHEG
jgi:D-arabinose 1-dehydrogenase-like Zn-dependent alcohol dehydrogenase